MTTAPSWRKKARLSPKRRLGLPLDAAPKPVRGMSSAVRRWTLPGSLRKWPFLRRCRPRPRPGLSRRCRRLSLLRGKSLLQRFRSFPGLTPRRSPRRVRKGRRCSLCLLLHFPTRKRCRYGWIPLTKVPPSWGRFRKLMRERRWGILVSRLSPGARTSPPRFSDRIRLRPRSQTQPRLRLRFRRTLWRHRTRLLPSPTEGSRPGAPRSGKGAERRPPFRPSPRKKLPIPPLRGSRKSPVLVVR